MEATTTPVKAQRHYNPTPTSLQWSQGQAPSTSNHHSNDHLPQLPPLPPPRVGTRSALVHRTSFTSCSSSITPLPPCTESGLPKTTADESHKQEAITDKNGKEKEFEEGSSCQWNLRPRRGVSAARNVGEPSKEVAVSAEGAVNVNEGGGCSDVKSMRRKFWISLSREEIEEDIFALTGSRPSRKPRKRPRNEQKVHDYIFPGLRLAGVSPYSYKLSEAAMTRNV